MIKDFPELRELSLNCRSIDTHERADFAKLCKLEKLVLRGPAVYQFPKVPESLVHLDIRVDNLNMYAAEVKALPSVLETLGLPENYTIDNTILLSLLSATTSLRSLDVCGCPRINTHSMEWFLDAGHGDSLEHLSLAGNPTFSDEVTRELGRLKKLKRLDISNTRISGIGIANLVYREGSQLGWLGLDNCINVGRDAIDAAKAVGVSVSHRMDEYFGGRRVRY